MQADERIVNYMKERSSYAKMLASVIAVQLFALAVYFCFYALFSGGVFYSLTAHTGKITTIAISAVIAMILCVVNYLTTIRSRKVYITRPDRIAINDTFEIIRVAYDTARPVLIFKITYSLVIIAGSALVYIIFGILMEDQALASIYGRIVICLATAAAVMIAYPCIDRISCYRALLNETHELSYDTGFKMAPMYILSFAIPITVFAWYVVRYYSGAPWIAIVVFPVAALFSFAISYLSEWVSPEKE